MKAHTEHVVPLPPRAMAIIREMQAVSISDYIFPGQSPRRPLSNTAMTMAMRRLGAGEFTTHGFRSAFRDWCGDQTSFPRELAEMALAHKVGDATEQAYRRGSALAKRRKLTEAWAAYCGGQPGGKVVAMRAPA